VAARVTARVAEAERQTTAVIESRRDAAGIGLVLTRSLELSRGATRLSGEDAARPAATRWRRAGASAAKGPPANLVARFHLHPDIRAARALGGRAVALALADGARWLMQAEADMLSLEPSRYYDSSRARPRATMQIVAKRALGASPARITWSLEPIERVSPPAAPGRRTAAASAE
jgi:uncharacterized heparinase superfamily protein